MQRQTTAGSCKTPANHPPAETPVHTTPPHPEQRRYQRVTVHRPCKVFHAPSGKYWAGATCDVSAGGCLLRVDSPRGLKPGQELEVYVAWRDRALLSASDGIPAVITRVLRSDQGQFLGVQFKAPIAQPAHTQAPRVEAA